MASSHKRSLEAAKEQLNQLIQSAHQLIDESGPNDETKKQLLDVYDNIASRRQALHQVQSNFDNATISLQRSVTAFQAVLQDVRRLPSTIKVSLNVSSTPSKHQEDSFNE